MLAPGAFWRILLRPKLDRLLHKKLPPNKSFRADDTNVSVSVTDRSERDLVKRFDELNIEWKIIEKQLQAWGHLFRAGKRLRIDLSFNYTEVGPAAGASARHGTKRGYSQYMLSERALQLDAEEESSGQPSIWRDVYNLMRCPGPPCHLGPYCWRDTVGKKHYKLHTHHLRSLVKHVEQGSVLQDHDDVPEDIRRQLYAEEQQHVERQRRRTAASSGAVPPIQITNILPGQSSQSTSVYSAAATPAPADEIPCRSSVRVDIPGLRDDAVREYTAWHCSQVRSEMYKTEYQKAGDVTLAECLNLQQVYQDQDVEFYVIKGVKRAVARSYVSDVEVWVKQRRT